MKYVFVKHSRSGWKVETFLVAISVTNNGSLPTWKCFSKLKMENFKINYLTNFSTAWDSVKIFISYFPQNFRHFSSTFFHTLSINLVCILYQMLTWSFLKKESFELVYWLFISLPPKTHLSLSTSTCSLETFFMHYYRILMTSGCEVLKFSWQSISASMEYQMSFFSTRRELLYNIVKRRCLKMIYFLSFSV